MTRLLNARIRAGFSTLKVVVSASGQRYDARIRVRLHPSNTGYGIMANEFIKDINAAFHTQIPPADILRIAEHDPLILP